MRKITKEQILNINFYYITPLEEFMKQTIHGLRKYWKCKCVCGKIIERSERALYSLHTRGFKQSCGCKHSMKQQCGNKAKQWNGIGEISGNFIGQIKTHARQRNLEFNITKEYLWNLFLKQNKKCILSGLNLEFSTRREQLFHNKEQTASLDRIDSTKGYIEGNVQWIHKDINRMKWSLTQSKLIEYCKLIANRY